MFKNKLWKYTLVILISVVLFQSCKVGQSYSKPDLNLPAEYKKQDKVDSLVSWRTFFNDENLTVLIEEALSKNNEIKTSLLTLNQLELSQKQAKLNLVPTINFDTNAGRTYQSENSLNGSVSEQFTGESYLDDYTSSLSLSWEADIWGKTKWMKEEAKANYFAQHNNIVALKTRIISEVVQSYFNLIALREKLDIAESNVALSDSTLHIVKMQYQSGQVNSLAVDQIKAQKYTAELLIPQIIQSIQAQENALNILCGKYPEEIKTDGKLNIFLTQSLFTQGIPSYLLMNRPDVKAAEFNVVSKYASTGLSKAQMYPSISISAQSGVNSFKSSNWFNIPASLFHNVAANLAMPIFQKKQLKTNFEMAKLEREKSIVTFRQTVLTAVEEVSNNVSLLENSKKRLEIVNQKNEVLERANRKAFLLYKNGMANYLEVLTAQSNALQNDIESVDIQLDRLNAYTNLYRALGGGVN